MVFRQYEVADAFVIGPIEQTICGNLDGCTGKAVHLCEFSDELGEIFHVERRAYRSDT